MQSGEGIEAPDQFLTHITRPPRCGRRVLRQSSLYKRRSYCSPPLALQELEEAYQDAASNVLVAICRHSWRAVAQHLETEVLTGVFPHRSFLYVMGILTSKRKSCSWVLRHPQANLCPGLAWWGWGR